jgi:polysaccharide export outer membrane protein
MIEFRKDKLTGALVGAERNNMMNLLRQTIRRAAPALAALALCPGVSAFQNAPVASNPPPSELGELRKHYPSPTNGISTNTNASPLLSTNLSQVLRESDTIHISFPGAPNLDTTQTIRRDGMITLDLIGEMKAAGLTPHQLEEQLLDKYGPQLVVKEVSVTVQGSVFILYVTGAVMRPGKIMMEQVPTPLEAVLEAGLDQTRANLKNVKVLRENADGKTEVFKLNLKDVMKGKPTQPFLLKPMDKIIVPEKFSWF